MLYCITMGIVFPEGDWFRVKAGYSNSLWFPIKEILLPCLGILFILIQKLPQIIYPAQVRR